MGFKPGLGLATLSRGKGRPSSSFGTLEQRSDSRVDDHCEPGGFFPSRYAELQKLNLGKMEIRDTQGKIVH